MHVTFELPSPWTSEPLGSRQVWTHPECGIRIEVDPLTELATDRKAWGERVLMRQLPAGGTVRQNEMVNSVSHTGWPLTLVSTVVLDADESPLESRFTMFYEFLYYGSAIAAMVGKPDVERWESEFREPLMDAMLRLQPAFRSDEVAGIGELWNMTVSPGDSNQN